MFANRRISAAIEPDPDALGPYSCLLPPTDQDFDGIGDLCDKCRFDYDPDNLEYTDDDGKHWPEFGHYCFGAYHPKACLPHGI